MAATESAARATKNVHAGRLLSMPGVQGVGVEKDSGGGFVVAVHVDADTSPSPQLPNELDGVPVRIVHGEPFRKFDVH